MIKSIRRVLKKKSDIYTYIENELYKLPGESPATPVCKIKLCLSFQMRKKHISSLFQLYRPKRICIVSFYKNTHTYIESVFHRKPIWNNERIILLKKKTSLRFDCSLGKARNMLCKVFKNLCIHVHLCMHHSLLEAAEPCFDFQDSS